MNNVLKSKLQDAQFVDDELLSRQVRILTHWSTQIEKGRATLNTAFENATFDLSGSNTRQIRKAQ